MSVDARARMRQDGVAMWQVNARRGRFERRGAMSRRKTRCRCAVCARGVPWDVSALSRAVRIVRANRIAQEGAHGLRSPNMAICVCHVGSVHQRESAGAREGAVCSISQENVKVYEIR